MKSDSTHADKCKCADLVDCAGTYNCADNHTVRDTIKQPILSATYSLDEEWVETYINHFGTEPSFF